ncbi:hypothetical protein HPT27_07280 [Permianibacter sp. IMCC34836]|uniref:hypothetical protein n=1 Tax=Permianibacter fluminis TaxID=2738515 RepID=UPI001553752D|nr:hypothetical protein [Permianibacter fluminis]NQD36825.1 hypothetical protein [Permianibacter fluminis]
MNATDAAVDDNVNLAYPVVAPLPAVTNPTESQFQLFNDLQLAAADTGWLSYTPPLVNSGPIKYRLQTDRLSQPTPTDYSPSQLGGEPYSWRSHGITATYVDNSSGWYWLHVGGDWLDRNGIAQGPTPWFSFDAKKPPVAGAVTHTVDVTALMNAVLTRHTWNAMLMKPGSAARVIAGWRHPTAYPRINVIYTDGTSAVLNAIYSAKMSTSSAYVLANSPSQTLPVVLEFAKPTKAVRSASLNITVLEHTSGSSSIVTGNLLNPPINNDPVEQGLAASAGLYDAGLQNIPSVIGVHGYGDGSQRSDFISSSGLSVTSESNYSPDIWGRGPKDTSKFPYLDLGKYIAAGSNFELVSSTYVGEGFKPLAPGIGAMRVKMAAEPGLTNGSVIDHTGTTASIARIFLPDEDFGLLKRIFVRYYIMFGTPLDSTFAKRYEVRHSPTGAPIWTDMAGKTGITPSHTNRYGYSGSSGGGFGWQMRLSYAIRNLEMGAPSGGAISLGLHTYDFLTNQPPGHKYGITDQGKDKMFGQRGGLGGVIYPGQWYCLEMEVNLNTVMPEPPGWIADGSVNVWIDGRAAFKRTGMVMRSLPIETPEYLPYSTRPARELGHAYLDFNWYHGGTTENPVDMTLFVTKLAWAKAYIGPMRTQ